VTYSFIKATSVCSPAVPLSWKSIRNSKHQRSMERLKVVCALWCHVDTGVLHRPLGPWKFPSISLRRSWPFHWDPPSCRVLVRTQGGCSTLQPSSRGLRSSRFEGVLAVSFPPFHSHAYPLQFWSDFSGSCYSLFKSSTNLLHSPQAHRLNILDRFSKLGLSA
jgi:hypothetical protein